MTDALLPTKLYVPPGRADWIKRPRLLDRLAQARPCKLVLVSAPAGYGKTTLVTAWLQQVVAAGAGQICWLSLDEDDSEPQQFFRYLAAALEPLPGVGTRLSQVLTAGQPASTKILVNALVQDVASVSTPFYLVLDDYHALDSAAVDEALATLLALLPPQMTIVLTSRSDPGFPIARLRSRGELIELRADDLRFTTAEAAAFMQQTMGLTVAPEQAATLERLTEGWAAGLQLAALSLQNRDGDDLEAFIAAFGGSHRFVLDYLVEEVLQQQPSSVRAFLLSTVILERLSGPLCTAVTGRADSAHLLAALERGNLFVVPLDDQRRWYRYHHLFADVLRAHALAQGEPAPAILHQRASRWYAENGYTVEAIRHALAAADFAWAAELIELAQPSLEGHFQSTLWLAWVQALPEELLRNRPVLSVGYGWALLDTGDMVTCESRLRDAERWLDSPGPEMVVVDQAQFASLPSSIAVARAYRALALGDVPGTIHQAQRALALLPPGEQRWRTAATSLLGLTHWANGDLPAADRIITDFLRTLLAAGNPDVTGLAFVLADIQMTLGRLQAAERTCEQVLQFATAQEDPPLVGAADLVRSLAEIACERGELQTAAQQLQHAADLGEDAFLTDWPARLAIAQGRLHHSQGDAAAALALFQEAEQVKIPTPLPDVRPAAAWQARILAAQGRLAEALDWVRVSGISAADELSFVREFDHITLARVLIAQHRTGAANDTLDTALRLLARLLDAAEAGERTGSVIEILLLQALAYEARGDSTAAMGPLERALLLAEPQGYTRLFLDEGPPMIALLQAAARQGVAPAYVSQLWDAAAQDAQDTAVSQPLVDPLSDRELEILTLFAAGLKNKEIAAQLVISLNTVLYHSKNIYSKLGVNKRTLAIARARELRLID